MYAGPGGGLYEGPGAVFTLVQAGRSMVARLPVTNTRIKAHGDRAVPARQRTNGCEQIAPVAASVGAGSS